MIRLFILEMLFLTGAVLGCSESKTVQIKASELRDGNIDVLEKLFDQDQGKPRLILLLSPT